MITYNELKNLIDTGYDIEFSYKGKMYSITKTKRDTVSFCESYKEPNDFNTSEDFINNAKIDNELLSDIWESITDFID